MIRQIKNLFSVSSLRTELSGSIEFIGLTKLFHKPHPLFLLLHLLLLLHFLSCNSATQPPPDTGAITLSVEDASCTEAWINLKAENITLPAAVTLKQSENNGEEKVRQVINLTTADTLLFVDSLLPKRNYKFKAEWINNSGKLKTAEAAVVTMDTTSHNFTWQEFTIGDWQSYLTDVWGTDENNVWACGTVIINDTAWGVIKWNGIEWRGEKRRGGAQAIYGFSSEDIWIAGTLVYHFNGTSWVEITDTLLKGNIPYSSLWGTSSSNMYFGNQWGKIIHWDGKKGTNLGKISEHAITGISGYRESVIYISASKLTENEPCELFFYNGVSFQKIAAGSLNPSPNELRGPFTDVWTLDGKQIYLCGNFINILKNNEWKQINPKFLSLKINGIKSNHLIAVGSFGGVSHFNGISWFKISNPITSSVHFSSVKIIANSVFIVGDNDNHHATIFIGKQ